ncbi:hypothetical protein [Spirosoma sordidisoli]|uniref:Uncharacterized protein n=1 Tax=Spirosoma sordidisoli TaxID=2502893 RepID=A0A4Q2UF55_9BACT|nr:hypothetical protein [Spirosoma sordidisoli]RYC66972.1 hypothetical protein EQG79_26730 [Spirosoma sordidisoli]
MQKKTYFQTMYRRRDPIKETLLAFFLGLSSYPRMLIETLIRRDMGERYFSFSGAMTLAIVLGFIPLFLMKGLERLYGGITTFQFLGTYMSWYLYLAVFVYMAIQRRDEIKHLPGVFDFARFSLSTGLIHPWFRSLEWQGRRFDVRTIETVLEPGVFFFSGMILWFSGQPIGFILVVSSIFYSFSYRAAYHAGDNYIMDKIDERICNEELVNTFVDDKDDAQARGFHFYGRRPADPDARRLVAEMFMQEDESVEVM